MDMEAVFLDNLTKVVATRVMGWKPPTDPDWIFRPGVERPKCPVDWSKEDYLKPSAELEEWRSRYHWREPNGVCWTVPHSFAETPQDDYRVLQHIRKTWDLNAQEWFWSALVGVWKARLRKPDVYNISLNYEPGDYSRAALTALGNMNSEAFVEHLNKASAKVKTWPEWKKCLLGG